MHYLKSIVIYLVLLSLASCDFLGLESTSIYFPLRVGNSWQYSFRYKPVTYELEEYDGEMNWILTKQNRKSITILQNINGIHITGNYTTGIKDTVSFSLEEYINFSLDDEFIEILKPNFFSRAFKFKFIFESSEDYITIRNDFDHSEMGNVISLDSEWDILGLRKNVGIEYWHIQASHNSGPSGEFYLIDYKIK